MSNSILNNYIIKSGNKYSQSETYNNSCFIISNSLDGSVMGISGLIPYNEAILRVNSENLNKKQLYSLFINKNIKQLSSIKFGEYYRDLSINPFGRETLKCLDKRSIKDIKLVINNNNYKLFTNLNIVKKEYPNFLNSSHSDLTDENKKILNIYIYNNMFKNMSKKEIYSFILHNNVKRIINDKNFSTQNYCSRIKNINNNSSNNNSSNINLN